MDWRIGFCQGSLRDMSLENAAKLLSEAGCDAIELWSYHPSMQPYLRGKKDPSEVSRLMRRYGLSFSIHAPHHDLNIAGLNEGIRRESMHQTLEALSLAASIEAEIFVLHPGRRTTIEVPDEIYIKRSIEAVKRICERAEELDASFKIGIENMDCKLIHFANTPKVLLSILRGVGSSTLGITYDVAHANTCMDPVKFLREVASDVIHVHLADNLGPRSPSFHMPLGAGNIKLRDVFKELKSSGYEGMLIVEGGGEDPREFISKSLRAIREAIEEL